MCPDTFLHLLTIKDPEEREMAVRRHVLETWHLTVGAQLKVLLINNPSLAVLVARALEGELHSILNRKDKETLASSGTTSLTYGKTTDVLTREIALMSYLADGQVRRFLEIHGHLTVCQVLVEKNALAMHLQRLREQAIVHRVSKGKYKVNTLVAAAYLAEVRKELHLRTGKPQ